MIRKIEKNQLYLNWILADLKQEILFIPQIVKDNSCLLILPEAKLYFEYKNRYPSFVEVIV